ncbi:glycosyltransferase family 8 protein [Jeotgalibaca ciconiae]|uniref:Glycosyltransferase family 8 protein n=2 Tax=Jeotgalibaca TaxID=1470540 RepID=A0A3Q9BKS8_9LACT|nr:glycosyltransferase family 8 protein [Jeotgalibaca ciconiae]AZP04715.1 glycosyltransferase family 8 protein [Jeotgalibaca ciconiae]HJA89969.1 glycosyltransferase family 8 protein [Candidatus Jeotgalibaca merdavium]
MKKISLLFSIDDRFTSQLKTTLYSIVENNPDCSFDVYVLQKNKLEDTEKLKKFCSQLQIIYHPIIIGEEIFKEAPVSERYPETIYYRLLAHEYLPESLDKILYVDADILCINQVEHLFSMDMNDYLYAASSHFQLIKVNTAINKVRLKSYDSEAYFNSGVLLMNLTKIRKEVKRDDIFQFISENRFTLILPDQDVLNALYGSRILLIPDQIYNYDTRYHPIYEVISKGKWDLDWTLDHTVFLHFCGKDKPWQDNYRGRFAALYKHYQRRSARI